MNNNLEEITLTKEDRIEAYKYITGDDEEYINSFLEEETKQMDKYELRDYITLRMYDEMKHCIGYEGKAKRGIYKYWRNYFCTNDNDITWDKLVEYGLAKKRIR